MPTFDDIDLEVVAAVVAEMPAEFDTYDVIRHSRVQAAHSDVASDRTYDMVMGRLLSLHRDEYGIDKVTPDNVSPARWRRIGVDVPDAPSRQELESTESDFRRRRFDQLADMFADGDAAAQASERYDQRIKLGAEFLALLEELRGGGDVADYRTAVDSWSKSNKLSFFSGASGQMFLNQIVGYNDGSHDVGALLLDVVEPPNDWQEVETKFATLLDYCAAVKKGPNPAPGRSQFFLSYFWSAAAPEQWPVSWASAESSLVKLGWRPATLGPVDSYRASYESWQQTEHDIKTWETVLNWFDSAEEVPLDTTLVERCGWARRLDLHWTSSGYVDGAVRDAAGHNSRVLVRGLRTVADTMQDIIAATLGRTVRVASPKQTVESGRYRTDGWADARIDVESTDRGPGARIWVSELGIAVGLRPGYWKGDDHKRAVSEIEPLLPEEMEIINHKAGDGSLPIDRGLRGSPFGEPIFARWYDGSSLLGNPDHRGEIVATLSALQPACDRLVAIATGADTSDVVDVADDPLAELVEEFRTFRPYPTKKDTEHKADRELFAAALAPERIETIDLSELRRIYNGGRYGSPGPQSMLNISVREAETDAEKLEQLLAAIEYACWGDDEPAHRLDRLLDPDDLKIRGLDEAVLMKLLAITNPERFIPRYPYQGPKGKLHCLRLLDLDEPAEDVSRGTRQVEANDTLRRRLDPHFPGDTWGMMTFLYWLDQRDDGVAVDDTDVLGELADALFLEREFVDEIVELLHDKGQVIFYGPPGTGKTYLARALAEALTRDPTKRMLVQFHPSTSYEDFFEGYRPEEDAKGQLSYRLTAGPLAILADRAAAAPGVDHVMVIDEINRANLPKVFGELLFLLEYREESVRSLYRPDDAFELPNNLFFIGTMNTADRSIALVDAALRRRFHFIPFFPNDGAVEGLLGRWLASNQPAMSWVGELVDFVNAELIVELGGPHLQIGPSYFMQPDLSKEKVERIWRYNIYPFVEDQLFGEPARIERFKYTNVVKRFEANTGGTTDVEDHPEPEPEPDEAN